MKRKIEFNRFILPFSNLVIPLGSLASGPVLARGLGVENRGALAAIMMVFLLTPVLLNFGQQDMILVALKNGADDKFISSSFKFNLKVSSLNFVTALFFFCLIEYQNYQAISWKCLLVLFVPVMHLMQIPRAMTIAKGDEHSVFVEKVLQVVTRFLSLLVLLYFEKLTVTSAILVHVVVVFISSAFAFRGSIKLIFSMQFSKDVVKYSNPFNPNIWIFGVMIFLFGRMAQLLLVYRNENYLLGIFAVSQVFIDISQGVSSGFKVANFANRDLLIGKRQEVTKLFRQTLLLSISIFLLIASLGNKVVAVLFGSEFLVEDLFIPILGLSVIPIFLLDFLVARHYNEVLRGKILIPGAACLGISMLAVLASLELFGLVGLAFSTTLSWFIALLPFFYITVRERHHSD